MRVWRLKTAWAAAMDFAVASSMPCSAVEARRMPWIWARRMGRCCNRTRGDTSMITLEEVLHVMKGGSARIKR